MFDTKKEKYAYVQGLRAGARGKKPFAKDAPRSAGKSYQRYRKKSDAGHYRNAGQDDRYWEEFYQEALNASYGDKK